MAGKRHRDAKFHVINKWTRILYHLQQLITIFNVGPSLMAWSSRTRRER